MGFEAPLALLALTLAGLPIVAHLLRRADLPVRQLPTIALLRRAEASSRQRMRLVDLLLLIARVLMVAALAIALSQPFLRRTLAYGDGTAASVVIVLDDSMSMVGRGQPALFELASSRAQEIVESLPQGSEVAVVLGGSPPRTLVRRTDDLAAAPTALASLTPSPARGTALGAALSRARRELAGAQQAQRRIIVLSDLAQHARLAEVPVAHGIEITFESFPGASSIRNAAIVSARATPDPTTPGTVSIAVEVRSSSDLAGERVELSLERDRGAPTDSRHVELGERGARVVLHAPVDSADPAARVSMQIDDAIAEDNVRALLLRAPAGVRVLIVDGDPHPVRDRDEARFVARAIDLAPTDRGALQRRTVDPDTFATMDLSDAEVVVLANVPTPSAEVASRLREHVHRGGGLLIAPGDHFEARAMVSALGELWPARPLDAVSGQPVGGPFGTSAGADSAGGAELVPAGASGLARAETRRRITFEAVPPGTTTPLRFDDGTPAMVLATRETGRVAVLATTLDDDWTNLPFQSGFLPLMVRTIRSLAPTSSTSDAPRSAGDVVPIRAPVGATQLRITTPSGAAYEADPDSLEAAFEVTDTERPGVYRVEVATSTQPLHPEPRLAFVVASPAEESDLTPGPPPVERAGAASADSHSVVRRSLSPWLFLLAGLLAVIEAALRLRTKRSPAHTAAAPP